MVQSVKTLLMDFNSPEMIGIIQALLENDEIELNEEVVDMATEIASFYDEYMNLLRSKDARDIEKLRKSMHEIELRRIIEKLKIKYKGMGENHMGIILKFYFEILFFMKFYFLTQKNFFFDFLTRFCVKKFV